MHSFQQESQAGHSTGLTIQIYLSSIKIVDFKDDIREVGDIYILYRSLAILVVYLSC